MTRHAYFFVLGLVTVFSMPSKTLLANAGIFSGNGYDIMLTQSNDVEMPSEDITITPERGKHPFDGTASGQDRIKYDCVFKLKNLRDVSVTVQVGFPLDTEGIVTQQAASDHYHFNAHDATTTYPLRFVRADKSEKFFSLFVWDMTFQPGEEKTLCVNYEMSMSAGLASTSQNSDATDAQWVETLTEGLAEFFGYVTQTGKSWAGGRIGHARFTLNLGGFETYLFKRPIVEGKTWADKMQETFPVIRPVVARVIKPKPDEWKTTGQGKLVREIENYIPDGNIEVWYYMTNIPRTAEDTRQLIACLQKKDFAKTPATAGADFDLLRDFFKTFNGEPIENATSAALAKKQAWFGITQPCKIPPIVFETLEQLRAKAVQPFSKK